MVPDAPERPKQDCQPFLRWAGSKRRLLPILQTFWTKKHKRYVEPFAGSACLFFALKPPKAILGDLNPELIATYLEVKHRIGGVLEELKKLPPADREEYGRLRRTDPKSMSTAERAARFIYLNRYCFNGIYRTNLQGQFNVPYSGVRCGGFPGDDVFKRCSRRLQRVRFMRGDFERVLGEAKPGDLVYMDPPFAVKERRVFRQYHPNTFTSEDIERLRRWMEILDGRGINFVVSYAESAEANILKRGYDYKTVSVRRNIAGFATHRTVSNEVVIFNS
ncbi:MAG: Dam family site-specific DNA-(adenine-N6)-methyltransferase [Acidimicrobiia bacterium]|nr:Dam family site-specific DNA-(adenine-N6)-methyltransferase [Acidimicrobiia bacterium]